MSIATVVAAGGAPWEPQVVRDLEQSADVRLVRRCVDLADLLAVVPTRSPRVAVVATDLVGLELDVVDDLRRAGVMVVAVGDPALTDALGISARVGPTEVVAAVLRAGIDEAELIEVDVPAVTADGRVLAIWGPVGGPGRSTVATAVAAEAAAQGRRVVLVDADVQGGVQAQSLGLLDDTSGLLAACRDVNQGRVAEAPRHALWVADDLLVLTGLARADMWPQLRVPALERLLATLRTAHDVVVVDLGPQLGDGSGPRGPGDVGRAVLDLADDVIVVGRADPSGLTRLVRSLHELAELRLGSTPVHVVLNRLRRSGGWSEAELTSTVERMTGHRPVAALADDPDGVESAAMSGRLLRRVAPGSRLTTSVRTLVEHLLPAAGGTRQDAATGSRGTAGDRLASTASGARRRARGSRRR